MADRFLKLHNCETADFKAVPVIGIQEFRSAIISEVARGSRLVSYSAIEKDSDSSDFTLLAVMADDMNSFFLLTSTKLDSDSFPSISPDCPQAQQFERAIAEEWGLIPEGHPNFKALRYHKSYRKGKDAWGRNTESPVKPGVTDFFKVKGDEIHEVAVGPIHAGVIEPGHFRFQCLGEKVFNLEIALGYQHRGIEKRLKGGPDKKTIHYMETAAGDSSIAQAIAYSQAVEALSRSRISGRAQILRGIALELERVANHTGDLGALAGDIAYLPTSSYCGRLRGEYLNMTAMLCGNRFGRNFIRPGGVAFDISESSKSNLTKWLREVFVDTENAIGMLWNSPSVLARLEGTGKISLDTCEELGLVGLAARACGIERDIRFDFPTGIYRFRQIPTSSCPGGDSFARAYTRWLEIKNSVEFIKELIVEMTEGDTMSEVKNIEPDKITVSAIESWRGELIHLVVSGPDSKFRHYKIIDPSFHNWYGLEAAMRNEEIYNFPICNKSFSLSYCGHDL